MNIEMTNHATARRQQRGISADVLECLLQFGKVTPGFNADAHEKRRQEKMVRFTREFWFDITSFYGK